LEQVERGIERDFHEATPADSAKEADGHGVYLEQMNGLISAVGFAASGYRQPVTLSQELLNDDVALADFLQFNGFVRLVIETDPPREITA
jgi:hypothetical protein